MKNRSSTAAIFRIIAGGYLVYLGIKLFQDGILSGDMQGTSRILGIVCSIAFVVFGVWFAVHAIIWMTKNSGETNEEEAGEEVVEEVEVVEEPAPASQSLFARASRQTVFEEEEGTDDSTENETQI